MRKRRERDFCIFRAYFILLVCGSFRRKRPERRVTVKVVRSARCAVRWRGARPLASGQEKKKLSRSLRSRAVSSQEPRGRRVSWCFVRIPPIWRMAQTLFVAAASVAGHAQWPSFSRRFSRLFVSPFFACLTNAKLADGGPFVCPPSLKFITVVCLLCLRFSLCLSLVAQCASSGSVACSSSCLAASVQGQKLTGPVLRIAEPILREWETYNANLQRVSSNLSHILVEYLETLLSSQGSSVRMK